MADYRILDPQERDQLNADEQAEETYLVVADPMEQEIDVDTVIDYDAILCTGDMLYLAPPPGTDSIQGSVMAEYGEDAKDLYNNGDVPEILSTVQSLPERDAVVSAAENRYRSFFDQFDKPFYYAAGNQDIPDALEAATADYDVQHINEIEGFVGIDGMVPEFAGVPGGYFPVERTEQEFYDAVQNASEDVLIAHSIGDEDADSLGFEAVIGSKRHREAREITDGTARLGPYPDYALLVSV